jgi:cytochrome o ubiquinol oxidase subunit 1
VGLVGVVATAIGYSFRENAGFIIPAATVKSTEERNRPPKSPVKAGAERELELEAM